MSKTKPQRILNAATFVCKAISPSEQLTYTGNDNYDVFPDKRSKPTEQGTEEVDIRTKADPNTPTDIERSGKRNPYLMQ